MATITSKDGTPIGYDTVGEGPPLILVDGATAYRAVGQTAAELARLVAAGGRSVVKYDRRGRASPATPSPTHPSASTRTSRR